MTPNLDALLPEYFRLTAGLPYEQRVRAAIALCQTAPDALEDIACHWPSQARPNQLAPTDRKKWFIINWMAGRGWGKTRTGAEWVREEVSSGRRGRWAFVSKDPADARDVMLDGESGIMAVSPKAERPHYSPSKKRLTWPNGATGTVYSAEDPEGLRGPQHDGAWADELASWRYPDDTWDNLLFGMRITGPRGDSPQIGITATPRPLKLVQDIVAREDCITIRGTSYDNLDNLDERFLKTVLQKYEGTTLGRQEIHAEIITQVAAALWKRETIEHYRVDKAPDLVRVLVGVDPQAATGQQRRQFERETGIVVAGLGADGRVYVGPDRSMSGLPSAWADGVIAAYHDSSADRVIAEGNQGHDMVADVIKLRDPNVPVKVIVARRGKYARAEPVAALYEQGRISHVGVLAKLEDQMCTWSNTSNEPSPDRLDAMVWVVSELVLKQQRDVMINPAIGRRTNPFRI